MKKMLNFIKNNKKKFIGFLIVIALCAGSFQAFAEKKENIISVKTSSIIKDTFEKVVFATGTLEVKNKKDLFAEVDANIKEIKFKPGQKVHKDQEILNLNNNDLILNVAREQSLYNEKEEELVNTESSIRILKKELENLEKEYTRKKSLYTMGAISQEELEEIDKDLHIKEESLITKRDGQLPLLKSQLKEKGLMLEKEKETLEKASVVSPMEATILTLPVDPGDYVEKGELLVTLGDLNNLEIETGINEVDAKDLKIGDKVEINSAGILKEPIYGYIEYVSPVAEVVETQQGEQTEVKIKVKVDGAGNKLLKPGYNVNIKIILDCKEDAIIVPYEAVVKKEGNDYVYVVDKEGSVRKQDIILGLSNALFFEVTEGLKEGEQVILNPGEDISDGIKVEINDTDR